ncbi:restriction endonuclease subunit S [Methanolobus sp.]|uniref:restriction endonuclease subunit S n=1 Tax=Methanolobus sp. TaxID=1874737 RepID=UPI0025D232D4|nr:restriction endonuclease subunit S [Methanolobus sp.]
MENELPDGWEWKKLGDIIELKYGKGLKGENRNPKGSIPVYGSNGIVGYHDESMVPNPCLILGRKGSIGSVHLSNTYCWPIDTTYYINPPANAALKYLYYFLSTLNLKSLNKSTAIPGLNRNDVYSKDIPLPPLETQHKIVAILEKAEETKKLRAQADELTQQFLKSVFVEMFGDPIANPKRWNKRKLGELCRIRRGASPRPIENYVGGTVPWVKIGDGTKGNDIYIENTAEKIIEEGVKKSVLLKKGSLIFANCGVSLGFARILNIDGCIHDGWLSLEDISIELNIIYLLKLINSISNYFRLTAPDGTQPNLNTTIMKNFEIPVPPLSMQNKFADFVENIEKSKQTQQQCHQEIDMLFNVLMQKAFTGELVS